MPHEGMRGPVLVHTALGLLLRGVQHRTAAGGPQPDLILAEANDLVLVQLPALQRTRIHAQQAASCVTDARRCNFHVVPEAAAARELRLHLQQQAHGVGGHQMGSTEEQRSAPAWRTGHCRGEHTGDTRTAVGRWRHFRDSSGEREQRLYGLERHGFRKKLKKSSCKKKGRRISRILQDIWGTQKHPPSELHATFKKLNSNKINNNLWIKNQIKWIIFNKSTRTQICFWKTLFKTFQCFFYKKLENLIYRRYIYNEYKTTLYILIWNNS